jgi:hypothetical protein
MDLESNLQSVDFTIDLDQSSICPGDGDEASLFDSVFDPIFS